MAGIKLICNFVSQKLDIRENQPVDLKRCLDLA